MRKNTGWLRLVAVLLILACLAPSSVLAAAAEPEASASPRASAYLTRYSGDIYAKGNGVVDVYFEAGGNSTMDELGCLRILIYESTDNTAFRWKKTFWHTSTSGMMSYNDNYHDGRISYQGIAGRYYKAYIYVRGAKDGQGDTYDFWTTAIRAT